MARYARFVVTLCSPARLLLCASVGAEGKTREPLNIEENEVYHAEPGVIAIKSLEELDLQANQRAALEEVRRRLAGEFGLREVILFGSAARGENDAESDLDVLVLVPRPFTRRWRHGITDMVFEVNLRHGTNLSTLVVERKEWENGVYAILPIHAEIAREGICL